MDTAPDPPLTSPSTKKEVEVEGVGEGGAETVRGAAGLRVEAAVGGVEGVAVEEGEAAALGVPTMPPTNPCSPPLSPPPPLLTPVLGVLRDVGGGVRVGELGEEMLAAARGGEAVASQGVEEGVGTAKTEKEGEGVKVLPPSPSPFPGGVMVVDRVSVTETRVGGGETVLRPDATGVEVVEGEVVGWGGVGVGLLSGGDGVEVRDAQGGEALLHPVPLELLECPPLPVPEPLELGDREGEEDPLPPLLVGEGVREGATEGMPETVPWGEAVPQGLRVSCGCVGDTLPLSLPLLPVSEVVGIPVGMAPRVSMLRVLVWGERETLALLLSLPPPSSPLKEGVKEGVPEVVMEAGAGVGDDSLLLLPEGLEKEEGVKMLVEEGIEVTLPPIGKAPFTMLEVGEIVTLLETGAVIVSVAVAGAVGALVLEVLGLGLSVTAAVAVGMAEGEDEAEMHPDTLLVPSKGRAPGVRVAATGESDLLGVEDPAFPPGVAVG